jgi:hypothetical protein
MEGGAALVPKRVLKVRKIGRDPLAKCRNAKLAGARQQQAHSLRLRAES